MNTFLQALQRVFLAGDASGESKAAERANISAVARIIHWAIRGDLSSFARTLADDVSLEVQTPENFAWVRASAPPDAVVQAIRHTFAAVKGHLTEITSVAAQGDTVVIGLRERGERIGPTGAYSRTSTEHFVLRGGKLAAFREIVSLATPTSFEQTASPAT